MLNTLSKLILLFIFISPLSKAQLVPIDERELSAMTGQAFINIDQTTSGSTDFTKLSFGLDVKTSLNSDLLEFGRYERDGEAVGSSDIRISDFALGSIDKNGNVVPFEIKDPFIELAFEDNAGKQDLIGVRLGFGGARGQLSGNIEYLTGNIDVGLYGKGNYLESKISCGFLDLICGAAKLIVGGAYGDDDFSAKAALIHGSGSNKGEADPIRASQIGMLNGQKLSIPAGTGFDNFLLGLFRSQDCSLLGVNTCFPLTNFKTLDIGDGGEMSEGLFLSFQTKAVSWKDGGMNTEASQGAFINIPNGGITVSFPDAIEGISRVRTRYADPYFGGN